MSDKFYKYRSSNGRIYEVQEDGNKIGLTITQARQLLNSYYEEVIKLRRNQPKSK